MRLRNAFAIFLPLAALAGGLSSSWMVPIDHEAIQYTKGPINDPVARLQAQRDSGAVRLQYEDEFGYLRSVLKALDVPFSSQVLVFSKTSFQASKIAFKSAALAVSPARRRASLSRVRTSSLGRMVETGGTRATRTLIRDPPARSARRLAAANRPLAAAG